MWTIMSKWQSFWSQFIKENGMPVDGFKLCKFTPIFFAFWIERDEGFIAGMIGRTIGGFQGSLIRLKIGKCLRPEKGNLGALYFFYCLLSFLGRYLFLQIHQRIILLIWN
jgi:hypothetical protein